MNILKKIAYTATAIATSIPMVVSAYTDTPIPRNESGTGFEIPVDAADSLPGGSIINILTTGMNWLLIVVGVLGVIGFVIAGILYLTAAGDEGQIEKGKTAMIYSIVGVVVALLGVVIIQAVRSMLTGSSTSF